jgi:hypothetical protein
LELRAYGNTLEVLINGVPASNLLVTDSTYSSGQPGIMVQGTYVSNFSAGGVGNSTLSSNTYTATYPTYTDTTTSGWTPAWPWLQNPITTTKLDWGVPFSVYSYSGGYGIGSVAESEMIYMGSFTNDQWIEATWDNDTAQPHSSVWQGLIVKQTSFAPGWENGQCSSHGLSNNCADPAGYYIETELNRGTGMGCPGSAKEVCGTPFLQPFKYSNFSTPWNNEYDFPATAWSPRSGDQIYIQYYHEHFRGYCKSGSTTANWQPNHSYTAYSYILDSNGNYEVADNSGSSGSSEPAAWGTSWIYDSQSGTTTGDNTITWEFFGAPCPPAPANNGWYMIFDYADNDLVNTLGNPAVGANILTNSSALFSNFVIGSGHNSLIDTVPTPTSEQTKSWVLF